MQVATTLTGSQPAAHEPTAATGRRVTMCVCGMLACMCVTGVGTVLPHPAYWWCGGLGLVGAMLLLILVSRQPQNKATLLVPWFPAIVALVNMILCSQLLATVWPLVLIWIITGMFKTFPPHTYYSIDFSLRFMYSTGNNFYLFAKLL